jgi:ABC-type multidrug transport system fused ATPase/permease subunit
LSRKAAGRRLAEVLDRADGRTLVVGLTRPHLHERFDRLLVLKRGKVKFDGTPAEWEVWRDDKRARAEALRCVG